MTRKLPTRYVTAATNLDDRQSNDQTTSFGKAIVPNMQTEVNIVSEDLADLEAFYNVTASPARIRRLRSYLEDKLDQLAKVPFDDLDQGGKVDFLLLHGYVKRYHQDLKVDHELDPLLEPWWHDLLELLASRQTAEPVEGKDAANKLGRSTEAMRVLAAKIKDGERLGVERFAAYKVAGILQELQRHFEEWFTFYNGYDPIFSWWVRAPYSALDSQFTELVNVVREKLVGIETGVEDAIVGQPSGRESLLADLKVEMIPYTPEELIQIGEREYTWCEDEMRKASHELDFGKDWRAALEKVKEMYVPPGQQTQLVRELSAEAIEYVKKHDMVTIPRIAEEAIRTEMMSPARQKANPFFLGGPLILVSYPTDTMSHAEKMMSMRGNSKPFSRSTVFHELVPGHHLQWYYMSRFQTHRRMFMTPFWTEGWAFYWEMVLYKQGFPGSPENRIGMLFWRMHRCIRIVFSLRFHLGEISAQECIDMLVERVGHERATAEGEVRRSFNGDYSPLYQAGYMLGALQFRRLREEVVENGRMGEKEFHHCILRENQMPVELVRAMIVGKELERDYKTSWRFYDL